MPAAALFLIALSVSADEAIWFSGPAFCEGICISSPPGAEPVPLNSSIIPSINKYDPTPHNNIGSFDISPDGQSIAFMRINRPYAYHDVWIMDSDGSNPREVVAQRKRFCEHKERGEVCSSSTPYFSFGVQWSPDGSKILYDDILSSNGLVDPVDGTIRQTGVSTAETWSYMHWSSIGIATLGIERLIEIVDIEGAIIRSFDFFGMDPTLSPDESKLSFHRSDSLFVYDIANETLRFVGHGTLYGTRHVWSPDGQRIVYYEHLEGQDGFIKSVEIDGTNQTVLLEFPSPPPWGFINDVEWIPGAPSESTGISPVSWGQVKLQH